jgi:hypothetical protein
VNQHAKIDANKAAESPSDQVIMSPSLLLIADEVAVFEAAAALVLVVVLEAVAVPAIDVLPVIELLLVLLTA